MNKARPVAVARALAFAQAVGGAALLVRPEALVRPLCRGGREPAAWIVRLLGARMIGQGLVEVARPGRDLLLVGAAVDATHALSMVGLAAASRDYRSIALASAGTAAASGAAAAVAAGALAPARHRVKP